MIDKDILTDFQAEAKGLIEELESIVETLEDGGDTFPSTELEQFAQKIDRIMGAAETLNQFDANHMGLKRIGAISRLCKGMGYKAAQLKSPELIPLFAAFWADTLEALTGLIDAVADEEKSKTLAGSFSQVVQGRLHWLSEKIQKAAPGGDLQTQAEIDQLMKNLGK